MKHDDLGANEHPHPSPSTIMLHATLGVLAVGGGHESALHCEEEEWGLINQLASSANS